MTTTDVKELFYIGRKELQNGIIAQCDFNTVVFSKKQDTGKICMQFKIPIIENVIPEKHIATKFNRRIVLEYTKVKEHTEKEIDWQQFQYDFNKYLNKFDNHITKTPAAI